MLVNAKEMLDKAYENGYAIAHFNTNNLEWTRAILEACEQKQTAVIIAASEGANKYMGGYKVVADLVKNLHDSLDITVPVAIHLDHGTYEGAKACIEAGFTSVMFDGSSLPLEENLEKTREIVELAHAKGISVEAEVGGIGGEEDGVTSAGELADVDECKKLASCGIDFIAAGIGNIHGVYPADWQGLNFDRLSEISDAVNMPIVLHGGTGIPEDQIKKAIELGVSKINVNTECQLAFAKATREYIEAGKDKEGKGFDPRKLLAPGTNAIKEVVYQKLDMFGSEGSANK
ncbi:MULTISPECIES: class II fructose-1,6-bisphosphate aldolase [Anaerococcus]|jgi:fructose-1,6-bisphosphate aldolase, class II|uniref:Fructose-1,6-bisphosphate aldolase, class II n=1 Tax=Anaerococcus octavius TaxID=54007 RepID=A0A2I1MAD2_9FIRM|nr:MULTISPECIES: class II fructose-1,6-bisphosphate aldolase [Anaerococcus]MBS6106591.1 class II fructose-1,6-bisphosphate aldolase [Anaerococcus sp.]MDU2599145.1 class II fructose-1,6-bisphosphate aldolase [Anaerococcus sp.]MDU3177296.1 class II fructose-1,6-bisphosphate aldolase [Anaerococcus sp.]MDU4026505.1 class II fructose-1,6-bisphosphate aldolase [Anaerococcus sp.]MDU5535887.1 class II fructose-1,6-bisphosphate aldolase [Anaerococcus sp.]